MMCFTVVQAERPTYDQWLQKRKEEEGKLASVAEQEEKKMSEWGGRGEVK